MSLITRLILVFSLLGNVLLAVALFWRANPSGAAPTGAIGLDTQHPRETSPAAPHQAFHWDQVDSPDFATFIANLRRIGCPETTLHDIVSAEVGRLYAENANGMPDSMPQDPATVVSTLLSRAIAGTGQPVSSSPPASDAPATVPALRAEPATLSAAALAPAAFIEGTPLAQLTGAQELFTQVTDGSIDPQTAEILQTIREDFQSNLQAGGQPAPGSPEYIRQWWKAKFRNDDFYSSMRGGDALNAAYGKAAEAGSPSTAVP